MKKIIVLSFALLTQMPLFAAPTAQEVTTCKNKCKLGRALGMVKDYDSCTKTCETTGKFQRNAAPQK